MSLERIVKAYDIRGLVGDELDPTVARALGIAAAQVLPAGEGALVVGRDMRASSPELAGAFADGVTAAGLDVVDIGLASTDMLYFASGALDLPGAMFTASHNPARYNGIKLCRARAQPVSLDTGLGDIRDLSLRLLSGETAPPDLPTGTRREQDVLAAFGAHVRTFVDADRLEPVTVAIDAANGMAGHVVPAVFEVDADGEPTGSLPFRVKQLYFELDGTFPNHPADPLDLDNLRDLQRVVRDHGLPLGLAFDGDADRMFAIDERGRPVDPSLVGAVVAERLLAKEAGATVLYNLICSRSLPETVAAAGGTAVRTRVGHSLIKQRMAETNAVFAAEHSAHYYFRDNFRADSGLIAALVLLEALADAAVPLSEVVAPYDRYVRSGEINFTVDDQQAALDAIAAAFAERAELDHLDGLTVVTTQGWFNLRPSNTEPLLRLNVEASTREAMERLRDEVADTVRGA